MNNDEFSWVQTHKELTVFLSSKENSQLELIEILRSIGIRPLNDKEKIGGDYIDLEEIDPFSFFCYIYKYGTEKRLINIQKIAKKLNLTIPKGEKGIPYAQAQKVWLFPYKYDRTNNEVNRLWNLFKKELTGQITDIDFENALLIKSIGKTKLTEALFYVNPEKYLPFNFSTIHYIKEVLDIDFTFNTYSEYIDILNRIKEKVGTPFYELSYIAWERNHERKNVNYWIFQGNPKAFDVGTALREEILTDWTVSAHKDSIKVGDKVILWITGDQSGCYALAEVTSKPHQKTTSPDDHLWKDEDKSSLKADIKITHNLVDNPILSKEIAGIEVLKNLKVAIRGTNFSATKEEYQAILDLSQNHNEKQYWLYAPGENANLWDEFHQQGIMALGWDEIGDLSQYKSRDEIKKALEDAYGGTGSKKNDVSANYDFLNKIKIGDIIIAKKGRGELLGYGIVTSDYIFDKNRENFQKTRNVDWKLKGNWKVDFSLVLKTLTDITKYNSDHPDYIKYYERLLGIMKQNNKIEKKEDMKFPLNSILYGPPGTGKTFELSNYYFNKFTSKKSTVSREEFLKSFVVDKVWWEIIALVILDIGKCKVADIFNHELLQLKASLSSSTTVTPTIWSTLQSHTIDTCESVKVSKKGSPLIFNKTDDKYWEIVKEEVDQQVPELLKLHKEVKGFSEDTNIEIRRYEFVTFHQSFTYEDFLEGIKPNLNEGENDLTYKIEDGIFKKLCLKARKDPAQNYAIFIDEINRGNISQIFGELITLIEEDKREGEKNELSVILPYSKTKFSVPTNLYIIGTMNTADRSVEALDTALRRRFSFIEMPPKPDLIKTVGKTSDGLINDIDLVELLRVINKRIEKLLDKDHMIGHSYFLNISSLSGLKIAFQNKILPLLQEYFYGDFGKIGFVLGKGFIKDNQNYLEEDIFAEYDEYDSSSLIERKVYQLKDVVKMSDDDFTSAIKLLLRK